jgi:hypothetical protein
MNTTPQVSVIVPVYNKLQYLNECIGSILDQADVNFEVIAVDDGSTDESLQFLSQVRDNRLRIISQGNKGVEAARNVGIQASVAPFIAFHDADDIMQPHRLAMQVKYLVAHPEIGLVGSWAAIQKDGKQSLFSLRPSSKNCSLQLSLLFDNPFVTSAIMVRREVLADVGGFTEGQGSRFCEDYDLWQRVSTKYKVANIPQEMVVYRSVPTGKSQAKGRTLNLSGRDISTRAIREICPQITHEEAYQFSYFFFGDFSLSTSRHFKAKEASALLDEIIDSCVNQRLENHHCKECRRKIQSLRFRIIRRWLYQSKLLQRMRDMAISVTRKLIRL